MKSFKQFIAEVSPPGWEGTVKHMKKHKEIKNPWALAWSMKKKGYKSHIKEAFKKGDRVVATKTTRGGHSTADYNIKAGSKGTYAGFEQGMDQGYHVINWDNQHPNQKGTYYHKGHEFKKMNESTDHPYATPGGHADHRAYASAGYIHPDRAHHHHLGAHVDFYEKGTGDKKYGQVTRNNTGTGGHHIYIVPRENGKWGKTQSFKVGHPGSPLKA